MRQKLASALCIYLYDTCFIRAQLRCGELLREMPKNKGAADGTPGPGRGNKTQSQSVTSLSDATQTIADLGISKKQSSDMATLCVWYSSTVCIKFSHTRKAVKKQFYLSIRPLFQSSTIGMGFPSGTTFFSTVL